MSDIDFLLSGLTWRLCIQCDLLCIITSEEDTLIAKVSATEQSVYFSCLLFKGNAYRWSKEAPTATSGNTMFLQSAPYCKHRLVL